MEKLLNNIDDWQSPEFTDQLLKLLSITNMHQFLRHSCSKSILNERIIDRILIICPSALVPYLVNYLTYTEWNRRVFKLLSHITYKTSVIIILPQIRGAIETMWLHGGQNEDLLLAIILCFYSLQPLQIVKKHWMNYSMKCILDTCQSVNRKACLNEIMKTTM